MAFRQVIFRLYPGQVSSRYYTRLAVPTRSVVRLHHRISPQNTPYPCVHIAAEHRGGLRPFRPPGRVLQNMRPPMFLRKDLCTLPEKIGIPFRSTRQAGHISATKSGLLKESAVSLHSNVPPFKPDSITTTALDKPQIVLLRCMALRASHGSLGMYSETRQHDYLRY